MTKIRITFITISLLLFAHHVYSAPLPLNRWMTLRSDAKEEVREIIRSEVNKQEGFSTPQEEKATLSAVEGEKETEDGAYKKAIATANKGFIQAKKRRDDLATQFQAVSIELEEVQKTVKMIGTGVENLDSQITRYSQDIKTQQDALKKWLQTEKQGEALTAVIFTRGFKDSAHTLESMSDQASAPLTAKYMGAYIQSFTKVINSVLSTDFIRVIEEGTAKWNNEEPLRVELDKGNRGTTYLRLKRYELYPFQTPKAGPVKPSPASKNIRAAVIASRQELDDFLATNGYPAANYDLGRAYSLVKETTQMNSAAEEGLREQVQSFQDRIASLQEKMSLARSEKNLQISLLKNKEQPLKKAVQDRDIVQTQKEAAERLFLETQKSLYEIRRVRQSIIVKTALATARGSQSPADASAEAIIDKLEEVKNDAKMQHSSSTTEVTNFQISAESSRQAVTEARITSARLISFINEGDSVRVKMAFRIRTVLDESREEALPETPQALAPPPEPRPVQKTPPDKKLSRFIPSFIKPANGEDKKTADSPEPGNVAPIKAPVKRNPKALGSAETKDVLFELISAKSSGEEISIFVEVTNLLENDVRNVAIYDEAYRWAKSKLIDSAGKEYEVSQVVFWKGQQKTSMSDAGSRGVPMDARTMQTAQLIFKKIPANLKTINKLILHPFVYNRNTFGIWTWQEADIPFQNIRVSR
jgi:hypothetical protein